jgi:anion-transporting  ArsA/GET3 family ATPase
MQGKFELVPTGTIGEQDPQQLAAKAQQRLLLLMQAQQAQIMGDQWEIDLGQAMLDWMEHDDPRAAKRILKKLSPQEVQAKVAARQQVMQQQQQQQLATEYMKSKPAAAPAPKAAAKPASSPQGILPSSIAQLVGATTGAGAPR